MGNKLSVKESLEYIKSKECFENTKRSMIKQVVEFLNHKYPTTVTTLDKERDMFIIEGEDKEAVFNDLREIGLI